MTKKLFNPDPSLPVPPPPELQKARGARSPRYRTERTAGLLKFAVAYVAPADRGIEPPGSGEIAELRALVRELLHEHDDEDGRVKDFFVNARRLADRRGHLGRIDAAYCRRHRHLIASHQPTRGEEDSIERASRARDRTARGILRAP